MTIHIDARFENGVFIPKTKVDLANHSDVKLTIDQPTPANTYDDPNDPRPTGGVELVDWHARHRLIMDPEAARKIIESKSYEYYEEPDDAP